MGEKGDWVGREFQGGVCCRYGSHTGQMTGTGLAGEDPALTGPLVLQGAKKHSGKPHSLDLLLGDRRKKVSGEDAGLQESGGSENSKTADDANSVQKESADSGRGRYGVIEVYVPEKEPISSPFADVDVSASADNSLRGGRQMPVPIGIYPYSDSYYAYVQALQYQRAQEEESAEEESGREDAYAEESESDEYSNGSETGEKTETIDVRAGQIPLSYAHGDPEALYEHPEPRRIRSTGDSSQ